MNSKSSLRYFFISRFRRGERASSTGTLRVVWSRMMVNSTFLPTSYWRISVDSSSSYSASEAESLLAVHRDDEVARLESGRRRPSCRDRRG